MQESWAPDHRGRLWSALLRINRLIPPRDGQELPVFHDLIEGGWNEQTVAISTAAHVDAHDHVAIGRRCGAGLRSERPLMRVVADRLSLRWYLGYDRGDALPDHSSLTRIRERYRVPIFQRFFEWVVDPCCLAGLVWDEELIIDATKVRANADLDSLVPHFSWQAKQHVEDLFAGSDGGNDRAGGSRPRDQL
jgi:hypothetical protein